MLEIIGVDMGDPRGDTHVESAMVDGKPVITMKRYCPGCPYNFGDRVTEEAYNYGCLPSVSEINKMCEESGKAWACHSAQQCVCKGYAEENEYNGKELLHMKGVHHG